MSTILKNFYHNLSEPIAICAFNEKGRGFKNLDTVYFNKAFEKFFISSDSNPSKDWHEENIKILKRLDYKFYFDFCLLESENLKTYSPLKNAVETEKNFLTYGIYQKNEREFLYFLIKAFSLKKYRILYFENITKEIMLERLSLENKRLKTENQEFLNSNFKAQNQAVKMALLNRISSSISKTIDVNDLIKTALNELLMIFGAKKVYFAKRLETGKMDEFETEFVFEEKNKEEDKTLSVGKSGDIAMFDKDTMDEILDNKISIRTCLKEDENKEPLKAPVTRIILPIMRKENLFSIVAVLTKKKTVEKAEVELLESVSRQISNALIQAMLFREVSKKKEELEGALSELKETQLQLINSEKMASLGQLIASVAHEINTPLASICANNEIAKKFFEKNKVFDEDIVEILSDTNSIDSLAIGRIQNLVQSLKRFVRLDEETSQMANINEELDLTLNLLHHKLKKNITLVKNYGEIPAVQCFPNMLNQVFLNILMNSIQSVEKKADKTPDFEPKISLTTLIEDNFLIVKIADNGLGIKEENKKKIFQAGFTTKKVGEGTGLGLAICKKIIEKHKGEINFESSKNLEKETFKDGLVTVFKIKIPV